jgi:hypothetical protein
MPTFVERYIGGEYRLVWAELLSFGAKVRQEPLLSQAQEVARETMSRVAQNVVLLVPRLEVLGYTFAQPDYAFVPPEADVKQRLDTLERLTGPLPIALRAWCEMVGSVNFTGKHLDWADEDDFETARDPLVVEPLVGVFDEYVYWQWACSEGMYEGEEASKFPLPISPDEFVKAEISTGSSYEILVPNAAVDAPLRNEWHETTFLNYLRIAFRWGGFPGFERYPEELRPVEAIAYLTEGLLPI